jgi:hypothetical protein
LLISCKVEKASSFIKNVIHILVAGKTCSFDFKGTLTHRIAERKRKFCGTVHLKVPSVQIFKRVAPLVKPRLGHQPL